MTAKRMDQGVFKKSQDLAYDYRNPPTIGGLDCPGCGSSSTTGISIDSDGRQVGWCKTHECGCSWHVPPKHSGNATTTGEESEVLDRLEQVWEERQWDHAVDRHRRTLTGSVSHDYGSYRVTMKSYPDAKEIVLVVELGFAVPVRRRHAVESTLDFVNCSPRVTGVFHIDSRRMIQFKWTLNAAHVPPTRIELALLIDHSLEIVNASFLQIARSLYE